MQYKTITLGLVQQRPRLYSLLRTQGTLLPTLDTYASALRERHVYWMTHLGQARPASDSTQIASEALKLALQEV